MTNKRHAERIRVRGLVQGVGFRPTVWRLAKRCHLAGAVWNDAEGVVIEVVGPVTEINQLISLLERHPPPLSTIDCVVRTPITKIPAYTDFLIIASEGGRVLTGIVPDAATCEACLQEINDPQNRRFRYPFTNCTHCGPRFSIVRGIPYDRAMTSMAAFSQCARCNSEYRAPSDRRFHAQPNACPVCGPRVWLENVHGRIADKQDQDPIQQAVIRIRSGAIVAIKGIGGVHLACDAGNEEAVARLRSRKRRAHKAFALMAKDTAMIRRYTMVSQSEERLLRSAAAPIVVLDLGGGERLAPNVAPGQNTLGFMLPYTPLHHLLMKSLSHPIVLTSGNQSHEPQVITNSEAREHLAGIADFWLLHDRNIVNRLDDSVVRIIDGKMRTLRCARGYVPVPLVLPEGFASAPPVLALGGALKSTFCLLKEGKAIVSPPMGDLENVATAKVFHRTLDFYLRLFEHTPELVVVDHHPDYLSTQWGQIFAAEQRVALEKVQHHHAHIAACMAEHGVRLDHAPVLGIALDGLGMGERDDLWGGEFLAANYHEFSRLGYFQPIAMLGGARATLEPWRNTLAYLLMNFSWDRLTTQYAELEIIRFLQTKPVSNLQQMLTHGLNSPPASSCGRLFDAVAAAIGVCRDQASYEGQAAMELESRVDLVELARCDHAYPHLIREVDGLLVLNWKPLWASLLEDLKRGLAPGVIAARFHSGLINAISACALALCDRQGFETVVLSGGVFQNRVLLEGISRILRGHNLRVLSPSRLPVNDGGLSLGQAVVAAARRYFSRG